MAKRKVTEAVELPQALEVESIDGYLNVPETVKSVHVVGLVSTSISTDGTSAMIVMNVAGEDGPRKFALTCMADALPMMRAVFHGALAQIGPKGNPTKALIFRTLGPGGGEQIDIGMGTPQLPVILRFNPMRAEEIDIGITLDTALKLADILNQTPAKFAEMMAQQPQPSQPSQA